MPALPGLGVRSWKGRTDEMLGYESWVESFASWVGLISESFAREIRFHVTSTAIEHSSLALSKSLEAFPDLHAATDFNHVPKA